MTITNFESNTSEMYNQCDFSAQLKHLIDPIFPKFDKLLKSNAKFHVIFFSLISLEIFAFILFFAFLAQSALLAFGLAFIFLTLFSYFILRLYYQAQKPEYLNDLKLSYIESCKGYVGYSEGNADKHIALANACCKLANNLHGREYQLFKLPAIVQRLMPSLNDIIERYNCWMVWQDVHKMKELLLIAAVEEHIKIVKCEPTSLQAHASLANAYVMLSGLYADPRKVEGYEEDKWLPEERFSEGMERKFRLTAERAVEEFKIISAYAPEDPWVHKQLAFSYRDLRMIEAEIKEYEIILQLVPEDLEVLYKLGELYFQQGLNAQGLKAYEILKQRRFSNADKLIQHYGAFQPWA